MLSKMFISFVFPTSIGLGSHISIPFIRVQKIGVVWEGTLGLEDWGQVLDRIVIISFERRILYLYGSFRDFKLDLLVYG